MKTMKMKSKFQMTTMSIEKTIICFIIGSIFPFQTTSSTIEIAQLVGRTVSLNCPKSSSDGIIWKFNEYAPFYNGREFRGDQFKDRCRFENDSATGKEILKISDIKPEDAGLYECLIASTETLLQSTQLTVLDSTPTCDSNSKDDWFIGPNTCSLSQDYMRFSCAVSYHGTKAPRLQWENVKNNQIFNDLNCGIKENKTIKWISCTLTLKAEPEYDESDFRCKVMTSYGEQYNCSTETIKVLYFTREERSLKPTRKAKGDEINCSAANSNLKLSFSWMREANNKEEVVEVYTECSYVIDEEGLYYCNVSYGIKDTSCSAVVSVVQTGPPINLRILIIDSLLVLFVFGVVSHFFLENEQIKGALKQLEIDKGWPISLIFFYAVSDVALLLVAVINPNGNLLNMKYALTFILLILTAIEVVLFLLLLNCNLTVSSSFVKNALLVLIFITICVAIAAAVIVTGNMCLSWNSCGRRVTLATIFFDILITVACVFLVLFAMKLCRNCCNVSSGVIKATLPVIVVLCCAIAVAVIVIESLSETNHVVVVNCMCGFVCVNTVCFTAVAVRRILGKKNDPKENHGQSGHISGRNPEAPEKSETQPHELDPLGKVK